MLLSKNTLFIAAVLGGICQARPAPGSGSGSSAVFRRDLPPTVFKAAKSWEDETLYSGCGAFFQASMDKLLLISPY